MDNEQLPSLPGAEQEAIQIAKLFKTTAITHDNAKKTAIVQKMSNAKIIHFATHGLIDDFKGFGVPGAIAFAPDGEDNGFLTSGEILDLKLHAELVVLSACDTGVGRITGDGVIGLSRSLITAGVPSVIVSLATLGLSQVDLIRQGDSYGKLLAQDTPRKLALLVGINQYSYPIATLNGCINDVRLQQELLIHRFGFNSQDILTLTDEAATQKGILTAFEEHLIK